MPGTFGLGLIERPLGSPAMARSPGSPKRYVIQLWVSIGIGDEDRMKLVRV